MKFGRITIGGFSLATLVFSSSMAIASAPTQESLAAFTKALTEGSVKFDFRYRFENVDDDVRRDANANTIRTRLGYQTGKFHGFSGYVEMEDIREVFNDNFNSTENGETDFATVPDPQETELNQAFVQYGNAYGSANGLIRFGRQRMKWDNDRFIGNVGWRQNEQTYDGTLVQFSLPESGLTFMYANHTNVNRIFGDVRDTVGDYNVSNHNFRLNFNGLEYLDATAYYYLWESDEPASNPGGFGEDDSRKTKGLRLKGNYPVGNGVKLMGTLEYAIQDDYKDADSFSSLDYFFYELAVAFKVNVPITLKIGYEVLEGDVADGDSFITPFATLHAFQGWADVFLGSGITGLYGGEAAGIEDLSFAIVTNVYGTKLMAVYHEYEPEDSASSFDEYGSEIGLLAVKKLSKNYTVGMKYADFSSDDGFNGDNDVSKFWAWLQVKF